MRGAIAAGHPLTAEAGAKVLREGGNAVDALLAAAFTAFVTEGPLTGPAGGGFLLVHEPGGEATLLDCFFAVPAAPRSGSWTRCVVDFADAGTQVFHVGRGLGRGAGTSRGPRRSPPPLRDPSTGRTSWSPRWSLREQGVECDEPRAFLHGILSSILLRDEGGRRVYGDPARVVTEDALRDARADARCGRETAVAELLPEYADDLAGYQVVEPRAARDHPARAPCARRPAAVARRRDRRRDPRALGAVDEPSRPATSRERLGDAYRASGSGKLTGTTHISVVDGSGTAAALSSTLGSGSGVFRGGTQLNNMLGELDVIGHEPRTAGTRLPSMLTPTLVLEDGRPRLVLGSAGLGATRRGDRSGRLAGRRSARGRWRRRSTRRGCMWRVGRCISRAADPAADDRGARGAIGTSCAGRVATSSSAACRRSS